MPAALGWPWICRARANCHSLILAHGSRTSDIADAGTGFSKNLRPLNFSGDALGAMPIGPAWACELQRGRGPLVAALFPLVLRTSYFAPRFNAAGVIAIRPRVAATRGKKSKHSNEPQLGSSNRPRFAPRSGRPAFSAAQ